uniref:Purple acid phosphatase n=1 Tax=Leersia perrieri TaxID=77586 RepID=A0A0D9XP48_9ORYZ
MSSPTYLSPSFLSLHTSTTTRGGHLHLSGNLRRRRPRHMSGDSSKEQHGISPRIYPTKVSSSFVLKQPGWTSMTGTAAARSSCHRGDTRKQITAVTTTVIALFLVRTLLLACIIARGGVALIRIACRVAGRSVAGVAGVIFSAVNARCVWCLDQAAKGRSCTGTFLGDVAVAAMANSWRILVQGITSLVFVTAAAAGEYVRPPVSPLVLTPHDKPASHPQQVHISIVGEKNMRISWVTDDLKAPSIVEYGKSPGKYTASATGEHVTYRYFLYKSGAIHHVTIGPLEPSTTYHYRCGNAGDEFTLRTPPANLPVEFAVVGDLGQTKWTESTLRHVSEGDYDMLLLPGDLSYADTQQPLWDTFGRLVQPLASARPWMVTEGNHEIETLPVVEFAPFVAYNARWRMPYDAGASPSGTNLYYSFDVAGGAVHVVMLGSYVDFEVGSEQRAWLERDLADVDRRRTPWVVALLHAPWYNTNEAHQGEGERMRRAMESLLYEARVDVVFSGHVHAYERFTRIYNNEADSRGPMYITIGDGGNREGLALKFIKDHKSAHLSEFREASFGHGRLRIVNETSAVWTWHRNDDQFATVRDEVWLTSLAAADPARVAAGRPVDELFGPQSPWDIPGRAVFPSRPICAFGWAGWKISYPPRSPGEPPPRPLPFPPPPRVCAGSGEFLHAHGVPLATFLRFVRQATAPAISYLRPHALPLRSGRGVEEEEEGQKNTGHIKCCNYQIP